MSSETRLYPGDREPRAIKIRKPEHKARKIIIIAVAAIFIVAAGAYFARLYFQSQEPTPSGSQLSSSSEEASESSESVPEEEEVTPTTPPVTESEPESQPEPIVEEDPIPRDEWYMLLVNKETPLPDGYSFEEKTVDSYGHIVDARIADDLEAMFAAGEAEGLSFSIYTAYRTVEKQQELFNSKVASFIAEGYDEESADKFAEETVARPGTSEHNTGLALDIVSAYGSADENSAEAKWLFEHSWEYGFILRYPKDKESVTGFEYEPWHYRYVGREQAKLIYESGLCLEEYIAQ